MNKLKSIFIGIYLMLAMVISITGIYQIIFSGLSLIWLGAILINLPITLFISRIMLFENVARTSAHFPVLSLITLGGLILVLNDFYSLGLDALSNSEQTALLLSGISFVMYLLYNFWYSKLIRTANQQLQNNKPLPSFYVMDINGKKFHSDDFRGQATILMFFRGNWCPLCMAQIKEIAGYYQQLSALGAKIVLISPQPEKNSQALAAKFNVDFNFMTDIDNEAAKSLGIDMKNGLPLGMEVLGYQQDTVLPTVLITDKNGKIIYSDLTENYRIRPEPEEFIKVLNGQMS